MTKTIPQNFLTLTVSMSTLSEETIRAKYPEEIAQKLIDTEAVIKPMIQDNNNGFAIRIEHIHFLTKDKRKATSIVGIDKNSDAKVKIIKELKDPNNTHKYTTKTAVKEIENRLLRNGVDLKVNAYVFGLFVKVYGLKENEEYCYIHRQYAQPTYTYSSKTIDLITEEILKDPDNIVGRLKKKVKK